MRLPGLGMLLRPVGKGAARRDRWSSRLVRRSKGPLVPPRDPGARTVRGERWLPLSAGAAPLWRDGATIRPSAPRWTPIMVPTCAGPRARECPHDPLCPAGCEATPAPPGPAPPPVRLESLDEGAVRRSIRPVPGTVRKLGRNRGVRLENAGDSASQTDAVLHRVRRIRRCHPSARLGPIHPLAQGESWVPAFAGMTAGGWCAMVRAGVRPINRHPGVFARP
jgi:hypothetical protein